MNNQTSNRPDPAAGTFYGIGVGPGDPELLTLKAVRILHHVDIVFAASSIKNSYSLAVEIARPHLSEAADIRLLSFQMSNRAEEKESLWAENADIILAELEAGRNAAFLTLGDPLTYSTCGYLMRLIAGKNPDIQICSRPGIPSFLAAAALLNQPLVEGDESLLISSGAPGGAELRKHGKGIPNVVMLKVYKHITDINQALIETGLMEGSRGVSRCGREGEEIIDNVVELENRKPDYWSLIIAKRQP